MYRISKEKKAFVLFLSLFFLSILTITIDYNGSGVFGFFEDLGMSAYKPINQSFNTVVNKIKEYSFLFAKIEDLRKENEILKNEKKVFLQENSIARE
ncbi:MAG: hypothetical protein PHD33_00070, partial [Atribacterota bacterium]|nr:hypothetical protein [Atribacterota bacterium]